VHRVSNNADPDHPEVDSDEEDDNWDLPPLANAPPEADNNNNNISTNATEAEEEIPLNKPTNPATEAEKNEVDKMEC
jgi:hypothetical protein